jgi:cell division transport system permease protein
MQQLRTRLGEGASILQGLQSNPLPASFTLTIRDEYRRPELLREAVERYRQLPEIEDIDYGERWLERFHTLVWMTEIGVVGIGGIMGVAVMFIIATTVRLALYTRAEEIEIMQLVGATLWFIKFPFFLEGLLQGLLGASLAVGFCYGLFTLLMTWVKPMGELFLDFSLIQFLPLPFVACMLFGGALLGGLGSLFSLRHTTAPV